MIPVGARVGIGALGTALVAGGGVPVACVLLGLAAAAGVLGLRAARGRPGVSGGVAFIVGAWLVVGRLALGPGSGDSHPALPAGDGPWPARVTTVGTPFEGSQRLTVTLDEPAGVVLAVTAPRYPVVEPADRIRVTGRPRLPPEGGYGDYLRRTGVTGTLRTRTLERLGRDDDPPALLERTRRAAGDALARALPEPAAGLAAGILVGLRDRVDRDLAAAFTATGLSHVVAISGWNIALVAGLVGALLAGRSRRTRSVWIVVAIFSYTLLAGASASVVRAAAMAGVALLARETGRPGTAAAALGWAVAVLVVAAPQCATDVGLQLSAAATAGLVAWASPIGGFLGHRAPWLPGWIRDGLGVSLAAQAATLPIVLLAFGRVAPLSPVLNLAVVPLVPAAMAAGALALAGGSVAGLGGPGLVAVVAGLPGAMILGLLVGVVEAAARLPLANVTLDPPAGALLAAVTIVGLAVASARRRVAAVLGRPQASRRPRPGAVAPTGDAAHGRVSEANTSAPGGNSRSKLVRGGAAIGLVAAAVLVVAGATRPDGRAHVVALDVGQGDAILVTGPTGGRLLVDGGPDPDRLLVALDGRLPPWDRRIDLVVATHPHEDHVAGLALLLGRYRVGQVAQPGMPGTGPGYAALVAALGAQGRIAHRLVAGDAFVLDGIHVDVLAPAAGRVSAVASDDGSEVNDSSIVLLGTFGDRRFLLTGDAEAAVEQELVAGGLPRVDVLKAGHHGSRTSTTPELVDAARPQVALVSVGADNDYGHPAPEVVARLARGGAVVLRTDLVGTIDVALGAAGIEVRTERAAPAPPSAARARVEPALEPGTVDALIARAGGSVARLWRRAPAGPGPSGALPYHRQDARSVARGRRRPPSRARSASLAPPPLTRRRGDRRVAGRPMLNPRDLRRPGAGRGSRAPPRRRQGAPAGRPRRRPRAW